MIVSLGILLKIINVPDTSSRENQNAFNERYFFFTRKSPLLWDIVEKYCRAGLATDENMAHAGYLSL